MVNKQKDVPEQESPINNEAYEESLNRSEVLNMDDIMVTVEEIANTYQLEVKEAREEMTLTKEKIERMLSEGEFVNLDEVLNQYEKNIYKVFDENISHIVICLEEERSRLNSLRINKNMYQDGELEKNLESINKTINHFHDERSKIDSDRSKIDSVRFSDSASHDDLARKVIASGVFDVEKSENVVEKKLSGDEEGSSQEVSVVKKNNKEENSFVTESMLGKVDGGSEDASVENENIEEQKIDEFVSGMTNEHKEYLANAGNIDELFSRIRDLGEIRDDKGKVRNIEKLIVNLEAIRNNEKSYKSLPKNMDFLRGLFKKLLVEERSIDDAKKESISDEKVYSGEENKKREKTVEQLGSDLLTTENINNFGENNEFLNVKVKRSSSEIEKGWFVVCADKNYALTFKGDENNKKNIKVLKNTEKLEDGWLVYKLFDEYIIAHKDGEELPELSRSTKLDELIEVNRTMVVDDEEVNGLIEDNDPEDDFLEMLKSQEEDLEKYDNNELAGSGEEITSEESIANLKTKTPEEELVKQELLKISPTESKKMFEGIANIGFRISGYKNKKFRQFYGLLSNLSKHNNTLVNYFENFSNIYGKMEEKARSSSEKVGKGFVSKGSGVAQGAGNIFKYGRVLSDAFGGVMPSGVNPFRSVTAISMFAGRAFEAGKETRLDNEKVLDKTRIQDQEEAYNLAMDVYGKTKETGREEKVSAEDIQAEYTKNVPDDLKKRLDSLASRENAGVNWLSLIFNKDASFFVDSLNKKIDKINNSDTSAEEKDEKIKQLLQRNDNILNDLDRMVSREGVLDNLSYFNRLSEKAGKSTANLLMVDTGFRLYRAGAEYFENFSFENIEKGVKSNFEAAVEKYFPDHVDDVELQQPETKVLAGDGSVSQEENSRGVNEDREMPMSDRLEEESQAEIPTPQAETISVQAEEEVKIIGDLNEATVRNGDGIIKILERQLEADPEKFGYTDDLGDKGEWAKTRANNIAGNAGYFDGTKDVRLGTSAINNIAYRLEMDNQGNFTVNELAKNNQGGFDSREIHGKGIGQSEVNGEDPLDKGEYLNDSSEIKNAVAEEIKDDAPVTVNDSVDRNINNIASQKIEVGQEGGFGEEFMKENKGFVDNIKNPERKIEILKLIKNIQDGNKIFVAHGDVENILPGFKNTGDVFGEVKMQLENNEVHVYVDGRFVKDIEIVIDKDGMITHDKYFLDSANKSYEMNKEGGKNILLSILESSKIEDTGLKYGGEGDAVSSLTMGEEKYNAKIKEALNQIRGENNTSAEIISNSSDYYEIKSETLPNGIRLDISDEVRDILKSREIEIVNGKMEIGDNVILFVGDTGESGVTEKIVIIKDGEDLLVKVVDNDGTIDSLLIKPDNEVIPVQGINSNTVENIDGSAEIEKNIDKIFTNETLKSFGFSKDDSVEIDEAIFNNNPEFFTGIDYGEIINASENIKNGVIKIEYPESENFKLKSIEINLKQKFLNIVSANGAQESSTWKFDPKIDSLEKLKEFIMKRTISKSVGI